MHNFIHIVEKLMKIIRLAALALILLTALPVYAIENTQKIDWDNLLPNMTPLDNPLISLSDEQFADFDSLMSTRNMRQQNLISNVDEAFEEGIQIRYKLERQGLKVDALIAAYDRLEKELAKRNQMTNAELDGQIVRIPGYALPLEHKDTGVKEFLLVPYVGACIHVPPPPANQTVYVSLKNAHILKNIYEPVWVTGRLSIQPTNQTLSLVDGSAGVDTAYTLEALKIEPYEE